MQGIYAIVNLKNGHFYIGSSKNILSRLWFHLGCLRKNLYRSESNPSHFQNAWNKYGEENFYFCTVEIYTGDDFKRDRDAMEQKYIDFYWDSGLLYNVSPFANHPPVGVGTAKKGWKRSPEATLKAIETKRKNGTTSHSEATKAKISATRKAKGIKQSPETTAKIVETRKALFDAGMDKNSKVYKEQHGLPPAKKPKSKPDSQESREKARETFAKNQAAGLHKPNGPQHSETVKKQIADGTYNEQTTKRAKTFKENYAAGLYEDKSLQMKKFYETEKGKEVIAKRAEAFKRNRALKLSKES